MRKVSYQGKEIGYVYLMGDGAMFKIGYSEDPWKRIQTLKTGNPKLELLNEWNIPNAWRAEICVQSYFYRRGRSVNGSRECFALDQDESSILTSFDDHDFNSWLADGCPSLSVGEIPSVLHGVMRGSVKKVWRFWFFPENDTHFEIAFFSNEKPNRKFIEDTWKHNPKELVLTSIIRKPLNIGGVEVDFMLRALGNWRTNRVLDAHYQAAFSDYEDAVPACPKMGGDKN